MTNVKADRTPNWTKWRLIPKPMLWQCVALWHGIDPDKVNIDGASWMAERAVFYESQEFQNRLDVACANFGKDGALLPTDWTDYAAHPQSRSVSLREFATWVHSIGWEAPPELLAMAEPEAAHIETGSVERRKHNKRETEARNREWQEGIDKLAQDSPGKSHAGYCRTLAKKIGGVFQTIRRNTTLRRS